MPPLNPAQKADRDERAWRMRLQGKTEREIGLAVGLSQPGVHRILEKREQEVLSQAKSMLLRLKARQSGRLEYIFTEALDAWERSKKPAEREVTSVSRKAAAVAEGQPQPAPDLSRVQRTREGRDGDPAWLNVAMAAHDRYVALWGLESPRKIAVQREENPVEQLDDLALLDAMERELVEERRKLTDGREATP